MKPRCYSLVLAAAVGGLAHFHSGPAAALQSEKAAQIIAAQLHRQGVECTAPRGAVRDAENSLANEVVWTLRCDESSYRVRLIPHLGARIRPIR
jgi:hypothetical protein